MWQIIFKASAQKSFLKLPSNVQKRIISKLEFYIRQPNPLSFADVLTDPKIGKYRFRVGDYRVIFDLEDKTIVILAVGHRREIYK